MYTDRIRLSEEPTSDSRPRPSTGPLLLAASCIPVLGAVVITPVLPDIQNHFAAVPDSGTLVPFALALPSLLIALTSPLAGQVLDRAGRRLLAPRFAVAFAAAGVGFIIVASSGNAVPAIAGPIAVVGQVIASIGCGLLLPTLVSWSLSHLSYGQRGRGTGWWIGSYFLGQFIATMLVPVAGRYADGVLWTFAVLAIPCVFAAVVAVSGSLRSVTDPPPRGG